MTRAMYYLCGTGEELPGVGNLPTVRDSPLYSASLCTEQDIDCYSCYCYARMETNSL